jgi:hypothetical protein
MYKVADCSCRTGASYSLPMTFSHVVGTLIYSPNVLSSHYLIDYCTYVASEVLLDHLHILVEVLQPICQESTHDDLLARVSDEFNPPLIGKRWVVPVPRSESHTLMVANWLD